MKAISLWQPWATLWVLQIKKNETRSWPFPKYDGPLLIHAAKKKINLDKYDLPYEPSFVDAVYRGLHSAGLEYSDLPYGALIGMCDGIYSYSARLYPKKPDYLESQLGDYSDNRYIWEPKNMRPLKDPLPYKGSQGLFNVELAEQWFKNRE